MKRKPLVLAAGTVTVRGSGKRREYLLVHRKRRSDWSLPKGKLEAGELMPTAAVRETLEETTVDVVLRQAITNVRYVSLGNPKLVRYWLAVPTDPAVLAGDSDYSSDWQPNDEVDEIRWLRSDQAKHVLTYQQDIEVLGRASAMSAATSPLILLRHAEAEKRAAFAERHGGKPPHDHERPLTAAGIALTPALAQMLQAYGITRAHSSPAKRCLDTLVPHFRPAAEVQLEPAISEFGFLDDPSATKQRSAQLLDIPEPTVVACHRPVLPTMLRSIAKAAGAVEPSAWLKPGEFVVMQRPVDKRGRIRHSHFAVEYSGDQES